MSVRGYAAKVMLGVSLGIFTAIGAAQAEDPAYLSIGGGIHDFGDESGEDYEFDLQYRSNYKLWHFKPHGGLMVNNNGSHYLYGGLLADIYFGRRVVMTLSTAAGYYGEGSDEDLGSPLEFRSGIEMAYRFDDRSRLGLGFYHISNAGIGGKNPGTESLIVQYSLPTWRLWGDRPAANTTSQAAITPY